MRERLAGRKGGERERVRDEGCVSVHTALISSALMAPGRSCLLANTRRLAPASL